MFPRINDRQNNKEERVSWIIEYQKKRKKSALNPRARFPRGFKVSRPGDMIQIDVAHIMPKAGHKLYQFTAIDVLTKRRVLLYTLLNHLLMDPCFLRKSLKNYLEIRNIQTDNGSTFQKVL